MAALLIMPTSSREDLFQVVDVIHDGARSLLLEQKDQVDISRVGGRGNADERHFGRARATGIVYGVANVIGVRRGSVAYDPQQAIGRGLVVVYIVHADH